MKKNIQQIINVSNEIYNGYKALAQYLREISKFHSYGSLRSF